MTNPLDFLLSGSRTAYTRPATIHDSSGLLNLMQTTHFVHRHLDWLQPLEWLGHEPFWLMENSLRMQAALAIPADPPGVAWIRLFACSLAVNLKDSWDLLLQNCLTFFDEEPALIAAIGLSPWFTELLDYSNFTHYQDIVVLERSLEVEKPEQFAAVTIRPVQSTDLVRVLAIDQTAFELIWQVSEAGLAHAVQASAYTSVAEINGEIVGYQLSTGSHFSGHLARLAVLPQFQGHGIGAALAKDMLYHFQGTGIPGVTVNTQNSNHASLHLYHKLGFHLTDERFPVYLLDKSAPISPK